MAPQFATIEQYYEFIGKVLPDDLSDGETLRLNSLLQRASTRITSATRLALVTYLDTGIPKNGTVAEGYARATCAQAVWFEENGDITGSASNYDRVSMDGVDYSRRAGSSAATSTPAASRVAPESLEILETLPIWSTRVRL